MIVRFRTDGYTVFTVGVSLAIGNPSGAKARISGGHERHD
jgi:hypothetical protein